MHQDLSLKQIQQEWLGSYRSYLIGFFASFLLTTTAFFLVATRLLSRQNLLATVLALALAQAVFQLLFILHVGKEPKPRWETLVFAFMVLVLLIVVIGTLWIMTDLNSRMMPEMDMSHD